MAEADEHLTANKLPPRVPIGKALDCLHDENPTALTAPLSYRRYDRMTLDRLRDRLVEIRARLRGQIDGGRPRKIKPDELLDYYFEYRNVLLRGRGLVGVVVALSRHAYPAEDVKDHGAEIHPPHAVKPLYRVVIRNLMIETASLLQSIHSIEVEEGGASQYARHLEAGHQCHQPQRQLVKAILRERYPDGLPLLKTSEFVKVIESSAKKRRKPPPGRDTVARALKDLQEEGFVCK